MCARYKALAMTHPSMRASSMAAAGLRDDDDCEADADDYAAAGGYSYDDGGYTGYSYGSFDSAAGGGSYERSARDGDGGGGGGCVTDAWGGGGCGAPRRGSMELAASDGGSALRAAFGKYGSLGSRALRHALY